MRAWGVARPQKCSIDCRIRVKHMPKTLESALTLQPINTLENIYIIFTV